MELSVSFSSCYGKKLLVGSNVLGFTPRCHHGGWMRSKSRSVRIVWEGTMRMRLKESKETVRGGDVLTS